MPRPKPPLTRSLQDLLARTGIRFECPDSLEHIQVSSVVEDSRQVRPDSLFVAIRGYQQDGHRYIPQAIAAGACAVVLDDEKAASAQVPCLWVEDTQDALARLSSCHSGLMSLQETNEMSVIGVTGTNGKSTTCHLLHDILSSAGRTTALLGTIQYDLVGMTLAAPLTTPPAPQLAQYLIKAHQHGAHYAVMEASSHALNQRRTNGIRFEFAVFTNLSGDHLDYHKDREHYILAKKLLFDRLDPDAFAIVNADDKSTERIIKNCSARVIRFGIDQQFDVFASNISCDIHSSRFTLVHNRDRINVSIPLVGRYNISNALAAASTAIALGIDLPTVQASLNNSTTIAGRLQQAEPIGIPFSVFVDYAHTDDALDKVLSTLQPLTKGRLWCVFGCGGDRDRTKRPRMAAVSSKYADKVMVTSDNPRSEDPRKIINDIMAGFGVSPKNNIYVEQDRRLAIELALSEARPHDVVLIAGKGHEDYQLIGNQRLHFNDVEVVQEYFAKYDANRQGNGETGKGGWGEPEKQVSDSTRRDIHHTEARK